MLTSIGRAAARRITATTPRLSATSSQLLSHNVANCPAVAARAFSASAWSRLPASKTPPKKTTKAAAPKKAAAKKDTATDAKASKPKSKPKAKSKAKAKPKAKPARAKKPKKVLTPEEKEKLEIRELKSWALLEKRPALPETAWVVYIGQNMKAGEKDLTNRMKEISAGFKKLYSYEREPLEAKAKSNRAENEVNYKKWVETYSPERIYLANQARRRLARKTNKNVRTIRDERLPKSSGGAYNAFIKSRFASSGSTGGSLVDTMKILGQEWNALSDAEKRSYEDEVADQAAKYAAEIEDIRAKAKVLQAEAKIEAKEKAAEARAKTNAKAAEARARAKANAESK